MLIINAVSKRIKEILKSKKMTIYKLEILTGISHQTMMCILNCKYSSCNLNSLFVIIQALDMTAPEFFTCKYFEFCNLDLF